MAGPRPKPDFRAFGTGQEPPSLIAFDTEVCYQDLFPIEEERDRYDNILKWLRAGHSDPKGNYTELFVTMQQEGSCVGMAYLSGYRPLGWWFGNYFGVQKGSRDGSQALTFWAYIAEKCAEVMPGAQGIVFETERFRDRDIESVLVKFELDQRRLDAFGGSRRFARVTKAEKYSMAAAERIAGYITYGLGRRSSGALVMVMADENAHRPVDYVQPAMQLPLGKKNEVPLWLMVLPFGTMGARMKSFGEYDGIEMTTEEVAELIEFLYENVFGYGYSKRDASEAEGLPSFEGYAKYLSKVRSKVWAGIKGKRVLLTNDSILPRSFRRLYGRYGSIIDEKGLGL